VGRMASFEKALLSCIVDYVLRIVFLAEKPPCEGGREEGDRKGSGGPVIASRSEAIQRSFPDCHGAQAPRNDGLSSVRLLLSTLLQTSGTQQSPVRLCWEKEERWSGTKNPPAAKRLGDYESSGIRSDVAPQVGFEPTALRLTAGCSTAELLRNNGIRRRPALPGGDPPSTIGAEGLNFCVRNGNRWIPFAIATGNRNRIQLG